MKQEELNKIIANHVKWLNGDGGERAKLAGADLRGADLSGADLYGAYLYAADLSGANLQRANLSKANLTEAILYMTDLSDANLSMAILRRVDLEKANLRGVDLIAANLEGAGLPTGMYQFVGAGSHNRCTTYDSLNDQVICGCWGDYKGNHLDSFIAQVENVYGPNGKEPNSLFYTEYMTAITCFKAIKKLNEKS